MVDINQWRASIGGWSCRCTSISWSVSNNKVKTNPTITDSVSILAGPATLSLVLVLVLLLVLSGDIELNPGPGSKPDGFDVFHFLQLHSSRRDDIGRALKVDLNTRKKIEQGGQTTSPERKLEEVIDHWIQSCCSEVTWDHLIKVLRELQMVSTVEEIESCLLNDEKMKTKYNWEKGVDCGSTDVHCTSSGRSQSRVPECVKQFQCQLHGAYKKKIPVYNNDKKPSPLITKFIKLILIDQNENENQSRRDNTKIKEIMEHKMHGNMDEIKKKSNLTIDEIAAGISTESAQVLVLIKGDPGVGKTTLAWELCKRWSKGKLLQTWDIVLFVQLRDKNIREANTLQSLIGPCNTKSSELCEYIEKNNGAGLMLIFDGFDELSDTQRQDSSYAFFMQLLNVKILTEASIILTTRPSAIKGIPEVFIKNLDQHMEIHGFDENAINRYIECKFKDNSDIPEAFKDYVSSHHFILSLMYVPLHCALITDLYQHYYDRQREFAPKTLTELYTCLICCLIWRNTGRQIKSISELSDDLKHKFIKLAKVAATGIENKEYVFDGGIDIASVEEFGLLQRVEIATEHYGSTSESCSFLHSTLQEYLAAYYWSTREFKDVSTLFDSRGILPIEDYLMESIRYRNTHVSFHWPAVLFYSGLTGLEGTPLERMIKEYHQRRKRSLLFLSQSNNRSNLLRLLFESGNHSLISTAFEVTATHSTIKTSGSAHAHIKSSIEAYVTGYCIARANETSSVEWEIEMQESGGFINNLVHGIKHDGKLLKNIKGQITKITIIDGHESPTDILQFFNYLERIKEFLKNLNLVFGSVKYNEKTRLSPNTYAFNLTNISFAATRNTEGLQSILKMLAEKFRSLRSVSLKDCTSNLRAVFAETTINGDGEVHLSINDKKYNHTKTYCFSPESFLNYKDKWQSSIPANHSCCFIPYVIVRNFNNEHSFGILEHGYKLLCSITQLFLMIDSCDLGFHGWSNFVSYQPKLITIFDLNHRLQFGEDFFEVHCYYFDENKWISMRLLEYIADHRNHDYNNRELRVLATPENIKLLMSILKKTEMKTFKLIGDSDYLQPLIQLIRNDLKCSTLVMKNQPQMLHVTLDMSCFNCHSNIETTEINNRDLIKWRVRCDLDQLDLVKQQCSINDVISLSIEGDYNGWPYFTTELSKTDLLQAVLLSSQPPSLLKEFKIINWSPNIDEAKAICDGLKNNQGIEVVQFNNVNLNLKSGLDLLCEGLINHSTLKTLIIQNCLISAQKLISIACSEKSCLKRLILMKYGLSGSTCELSIDDYQKLLMEVAINGTASIEEVAICDDRYDLMKKLLVDDVLPSLLQRINCKLIVSYCDMYSSFIKHEPLLSGDTQVIEEVTTKEFVAYLNSFVKY